jgi:hypothetical protein
MNRKWFLGVCAGALFISLYFVMRLRQPASRPHSRQTQAAEATKVAGKSAPISVAKAASTVPSLAAQKILTAFATPITFRGRVVDDGGNEVPGAVVRYTAIDKFDADGSHYTMQSDERGLFTIAGIQGAVLTVKVSKQGYYEVAGQSGGAYAYGIGPDRTRQLPPADTATFVLRKAGKAEEIIHYRTRQIDVPKDGTQIGIDLFTGTEKPQGALKISSIIGDTTVRPFPWRFELCVPGGAIAERKGTFDFVAPNDMSSERSVIAQESSSREWSSRDTREYFVRLPDSRYGRMSIRFYPGPRTYVVVECHLNPSGSRNLEFDPSKEIKSH